MKRKDFFKSLFGLPIAIKVLTIETEDDKKMKEFKDSDIGQATVDKNNNGIFQETVTSSTVCSTYLYYR